MTKYPRGIINDRILLLLDCFGVLGTKKGYGQSALAAETNLSPQIIRRRASDARMGRKSRGMPVDQVMQICQIATREILPLREMRWQELVAWCIGLDDLHKVDEKFVREWMKLTTSRNTPKAAA